MDILLDFSENQPTSEANPAAVRSSNRTTVVSSASTPIMSVTTSQPQASGGRTSVSVAESTPTSYAAVVSQGNDTLVASGDDTPAARVGTENQVATEGDALNQDDRNGTEQTAQPAKESSHAAKQFKSAQMALDRLWKFGDSERMETVTVESLRARIDRLADIWHKANEHFEGLIDQAEDETGITVSYEDAMEQFEETYFEIRDRFQSRMTALENKSAVQPPPRGASSEAGASGVERPIKVIMPVRQQDIVNTWGVFDGQPYNWPAFRDLFVSAVHNNKDIDDGFKLAHLMKSLKGDATKTLGSGYVTSGYVPGSVGTHDVRV